MKALFRILTLAVLISAAGAVHAQQTPFRLGAKNTDYGKDVCQDGESNFYVTGYFQGTVDFDPGFGKTWRKAAGDSTTEGAVDIFVAKYNPNGILRWVFTISSTAADMPHSIQEHDGYLYLTGYFSGNADFDPGAGTANRNAGIGRDAFIAKYDTNGVYQWAVTFGNPEMLPIDPLSTEEGMDLAVDANGDVFATGVFDGTIDLDPSDGPDANDTIRSKGGRDLYVVKYSSAGVFQFGFGIGGSGQDHGHAIRPLSDGSFALSGFISSTVDMDPGAGVQNLSSAGLFDIFLARYTGKTLTAAIRIGGAAADQVRPGAMEVDDKDNIYIAGDVGGTVDFDPGPSTWGYNSKGQGDIFFAKFSKALAIAFAKAFGSNMNEFAHRIDIDAGESIYIAGAFAGNIDFDPGFSTWTVAPNAGDTVYDAFVAKYAPDGSFRWVSNYGSFSCKPGIGEDNICAGLDVDGDGNHLITGRFHHTADFNPAPPTRNLVSAGDADVFVSKHDPSGSVWIDPAFVGIAQPENPLKLKYNSTLGMVSAEAGQLEILDLNGRLLHRISSASADYVYFNTQLLVPGVYLARAVNAQHQSSTIRFASAR